MFSDVAEMNTVTEQMSLCSTREGVYENFPFSWSS